MLPHILRYSIVNNSSFYYMLYMGQRQMVLGGNWGVVAKD